MGALTGRQGKVKIVAASGTATTGEAFTGVSATTDITRYRITDTTLRHWSRDTAPSVYRNTTAVSSTEYTVNYVIGEVTFGVAQTTGDAITADVTYLATSYLGDTKGWEIDMETDQHDVTTLSTSASDKVWREFANGLSGAGVTLDRIVKASTQAPFFDRLVAGSTLLLELILQNDDKFEMFANIEGDEWESSLDALASETVNLMVDGQVAFSTY